MTPPRTAAAISAGVAAGRISAVEVCRDTLSRIAAADPTLHAFLHVDADRALEAAARVDARRDLDAPLLGVPIAVKDNICTAEMPTTAASRVLEGYVAPYSATVVERLIAAGAVIVGKTNCDEFAMGSSTEHSAFGATINPWAADRSPGGSSGGSAAAVAARLVPLALGSETGGSVRQPAALCGVFGLKPTYGRVSRYGLIAFASSMDQVGPFAATAADLARVLRVLAGRDARDATSAAETVPDYASALTGSLRGVRVGVPRALIASGVDAQVLARFDAALQTLADAGATIIDVALPHAPRAVAVYALVANAEASSNLARYDGVRYGTRVGGATLREMYEKTRARFGTEVKRRIMIGTFVLSAGYYDAYYLKAQQVRALIRRDYDEAFARVDLVAMPTSPTPAFRLGERLHDPVQMYLSDVFTAAANLAGLPAISIPCGFTAEALPVGLQLTGRPFDEGLLLRAADAYERRTPWASAAPPGVN
ncbi:MAG: Asp-tRNA(Asn)/Glu-tRNA(Gln) amidotransferase subunit GatA [Vicinamibacterales bacterium]